MPDRKMTEREAIIILDRLNTSERIDVDRDELRAAVAVAKRALRKQIQTKADSKCCLLWSNACSGLNAKCLVSDDF